MVAMVNQACFLGSSYGNRSKFCKFTEREKDGLKYSVLEHQLFLRNNLETDLGIWV